MKAHFSFGKNGIEVSVPDVFDCQVARSRSAAALREVEAALGAALDRPFGCEPLAALAAGASGPVKVCGFPSLKIEGRHALLSDLQQKMAGAGSVRALVLRPDAGCAGDIQ